MEDMLPLPFLNDTLLNVALAHTNHTASLRKEAIVPAGGGAPPDPNAGGGAGAPPPSAPAPAPAPGAGQPAMPLDPQMMQQMQQMQMMGGGAGGKGGGKKLEDMLHDAKLWQILNLSVQIAQALNIKVDPSIVMGPPPDPALLQQAQQEQTQPGGGGITMGSPEAQGQPAASPMGPQPVQPMDASQGPIGKAAEFNGAELFDIGVPFDLNYGSPTPLPNFDDVVRGTQANGSLASRLRSAMDVL